MRLLVPTKYRNSIWNNCSDLWTVNISLMIVLCHYRHSCYRHFYRGLVVPMNHRGRLFFLSVALNRTEFPFSKFSLVHKSFSFSVTSWGHRSVRVCLCIGQRCRTSSGSVNPSRMSCLQGRKAPGGTHVHAVGSVQCAGGSWWSVGDLVAIQIKHLLQLVIIPLYYIVFFLFIIFTSIYIQ